ncbi:MAG: hypothetical protein ACMV0I_07330 [Pseudomonas sp.]
MSKKPQAAYKTEAALSRLSAEILLAQAKDNASKYATDVSPEVFNAAVKLGKIVGFKMTRINEELDVLSEVKSRLESLKICIEFFNRQGRQSSARQIRRLKKAVNETARIYKRANK